MRKAAILITLLVPCLLGLAGRISSTATATEIQLLTTTNSPWSYNTNCATVGSPDVAVPLISAPAYDVSAWPTGVGMFGNEPDAPAEYLPWTFHTFITSTREGGPIVTYYRTTFNWSGGDPSAVVLRSTNRIDDGAVFYLNGTMVANLRVTADTDCTSFAANPPTEGAPDVVDYPTGVLLNGLNVLVAVQRQSSAGSSDNAFGMSLTAILPSAPTNLAPNQPTNVVLLQNRSAILTGSFDASPPPTYQWFVNNVAIPDATNSTHLITNELTTTSISNYFVRVSNLLGTIYSRTNIVTFTADTNPPVLLGAVGSASFAEVSVSFNEVLDETTANDAFNFAIEDSMGNPLTVLTATRTPDLSGVLLTTDPQTPDTLYTVSITGSGVGDLAQNFLLTGSTQFRSWVTTNANGLTFESFNGSLGPATAGTIAGNSVANLTSHPSFVNNMPSECFHLAGFDTRLAYPDDSHEMYGGRVRGVFIPPFTGVWRLYLRSDDGSELWFNPNGASSAGRTLVAQETGCCNNYLAPPAAQTSGPLNLTGGQAYYIEGLYKEGGGGDYLQVAARLEGAPVPPNTETIPGGWVGSGGAPALAGGTFTITQQPASVQVVSGTTVTFSVGTSTGTPLYYQWMRNGADITGAVCPTYSLTTVQGDNGARFSVRVSIIGGGTQTSSDAVLTVGADTTGPTLVSFSPTNGVDILLHFNEPLDLTTSQNANNYVLNGTPVISATRTNATDVLLVTAGFQTCVTQRLSISAVADVALNPLVPNPTVVSFLAPQQILSLTATWKYNDSGTDLGTAWRQPAFNDSAWPMGPAMLAYETAANPNPPVATPLAPISTNTTVYFRTHFNLPVDPSTVASLLLREVVDDGAVYYINGVESQLTRMAAGYTFATLATASGPEPSDGQHTIEGPTSINKSALVNGDNVLAVELHASSLTSSDSAFAAALDFTVNCSGGGPTLTIARSGNQVTLTWPDPTYNLQRSPVVKGQYSTIAGAVTGYTTPATNNGFFQLIKP